MLQAAVQQNKMAAAVAVTQMEKTLGAICCAAKMVSFVQLWRIKRPASSSQS